ncbi:MAG: hypothetical protein ABSF88_09075 [Candidatus Aminicenantales bacterium]
MPTILDFVPNDELKKYFWESDWYYCFSDDSDDEIHLEKIMTKIKIERRPNLKKKTIEFAVVRFDYSETNMEFSPFSTDDIWKKEEEAKSDFIWLKEFIELLSNDRKVFDGRYFWDFEFSEGKPRLKNKFLGKFDGEWI